MDGRTGRDTYYFNAPVGTSNADHITSYSARSDTIGLDHEVFRFLGTNKTLWASQFKDVTEGRVDSGDRILYNSDNGRLYYDPDGRGGVGHKLFATLDNDPTLTYKDFHIY